MKRLLMLLTIPTIIMAAPVSADPGPSNDSDFLKQIKDAGINYQGDGKDAVTVAKSLCDLADKGTPTSDMEQSLQSGNPSLAGNGAAKFMTLAAAEYCPTHLGTSGDGAKPAA
jgi:Protein of unknown function (DUF732)